MCVCVCAVCVLCGVCGMRVCVLFIDKMAIALYIWSSRVEGT